MKPFIGEEFLLESQTAVRLYAEYASRQPIIDYHCHLPVSEIAADKKFKTLTALWLYGDHYKWRAMRAHGVDEYYCTGAAPDREKFMQYAATVPYTLRNPLFHWTHLELQRYFGITALLNESSAQQIYERCNEQLSEERFSTRNLLRRMQVEVVCTTDDPVDSLEHHYKLREDGFEIMVLPTFRADKAMAVEDVAAYNTYLQQLEQASNISITTYEDLLQALSKRHDYFAEAGCRLSDHGLEQIYAEDYTVQQVSKYFSMIRAGHGLSAAQQARLKSAILYQLAIMDHQKGWTQQFHLGAMRNNNTRMMRKLGPDTGFDSIGDFAQARSMAAFFDRLDTTNQLTQTILYNLNPRDNYVVAAMLGNFNDGSRAAKMQMGSGWWFLDQKQGMQWQLNALSNLGLLSHFVGMLTDSRSFLSYPRHEYFRRILCNMLGEDVEKGELPADMHLLGSTVENICYYNAKNFFGF